MPIFQLKNNTKNYTYQSSIFNTNICSKIKRLHLQQTSRSDLGIWLVVSFSTFSAGYTSAFYQNQSCVSQVASFTPEKNSGKFSNTASVKLPHFPFHRYFISVEPPSTTSEISNPLKFLLLQTRPNCIGRSWNLSTKRPERRLHSGPPYLLQSIIWPLSRRETTSHLCFHSEACLYPQPSLRMPDWGLLQRTMAPKNTYNAINPQELSQCIRSTNTKRCVSRVTPKPEPTVSQNRIIIFRRALLVRKSQVLQTIYRPNCT